jgi:hypothetical protein
MKKLFIILLCFVPTIASARPWCGDYARSHLVSHDPGPRYSLACNWKDWGHATSAHVGAIVVWCSRGHHHVGKITGTDASGNYIVTSGNDGGRVRSRVRSVAGATFREGA